MNSTLTLHILICATSGALHGLSPLKSFRQSSHASPADYIGSGIYRVVPEYKIECEITFLGFQFRTSKLYFEKNRQFQFWHDIKEVSKRATRECVLHKRLHEPITVILD